MSDETTPEVIHATTDTPAGATIRLRGRDTDDGWIEAVEVVAADGDGEVITLFEGFGLPVTAVYNQVVEAFTGDDGQPLVDDEATTDGGQPADVRRETPGVYD